MENLNRNNAKNGSIEPHVRLLTQWLRLLSETCTQREADELTAAKIKSYAAVLADIPLDALEAGLVRCSRECRFFPSAAEIRERSAINPQLAAEAAWEALQKIVYRDWHPDIGWMREVQMDPQMEYAIRQCGGLRRIHNCPTDTFNFLRKDFLAAHQRFNAEGGQQLRLSDKQAGQILGQLQRGQLPS